MSINLLSLKSLLSSESPDEERIFNLLFSDELSEVRSNHRTTFNDNFNVDQLHDPECRRLILEIILYELELKRYNIIKDIREKINQKTFVNVSTVTSIKNFQADDEHIVLDSNSSDRKYYCFLPNQYDGTISIAKYNHTNKRTFYIKMTVRRINIVSFGDQTFSYDFEVRFKNEADAFDFSGDVNFIDKIFASLGLFFMKGKTLDYSVNRNILTVRTKNVMKSLTDEFNYMFGKSYELKHLNNGFPRQLPIDSFGACLESVEGLLLVPDAFITCDHHSIDTLEKKVIRFKHQDENLEMLKAFCSTSEGKIKYSQSGDNVSITIYPPTFPQLTEFRNGKEQNISVTQYGGVKLTPTFDESTRTSNINKLADIFQGYSFKEYKDGVKSSFGHSFNPTRHSYENDMMLKNREEYNRMILRCLNDSCSVSSVTSYASEEAEVRFENSNGKIALDNWMYKSAFLNVINDQIIITNNLKGILLPYFLLNDTMQINDQKKLENFLPCKIEQLKYGFVPVNYGFSENAWGFYKSLLEFKPLVLHKALKFSKNGKQNVLTYLVNHEIDKLPILADNSDSPLYHPIKLSETKTLFLMSSNKSNLIFTTPVVFYPINELEKNYHDRSEKVTFFVNVIKSTGVLFSSGTMLRCYLELLELSVNSVNLEPFYFVRNLTSYVQSFDKLFNLRDIIQICMESDFYTFEFGKNNVSELCSFFKKINLLMEDEEFSSKLLSDVSMTLTDKNYWIYHIFGFIIKSVSEPIGVHNKITFDSSLFEILSSKINLQLQKVVNNILNHDTNSLIPLENEILANLESTSKDEQIVINEQSIRNNRIFKSYKQSLDSLYEDMVNSSEMNITPFSLDLMSHHNFFNLLVVSIRESLNKDLTDRYINEYINNLMSLNDSFDIENVDSNKFLIVESSLADRFNDKIFEIMPDLSISFMTELPRNKNTKIYEPNVFFDATFCLRVSIDESQENDIDRINEYISTNLKRVTLFNIKDVKNDSMVIFRIKSDELYRYVYFSLPFEDNGLLICKRSIVMYEKFNILLLTEACIVASKVASNAAELLLAGYINDKSSYFNISMVSGISSFKSSPFILPGYNSFLLHLSVMGNKAFSLEKEEECYLIPYNAFGLYSNLVRHDVIDYNLELCKRYFEDRQDFEFSFDLQNFIDLYLPKTYNEIRNDLLFVTSNLGISTKDYGAFLPTIYSQVNNQKNLDVESLSLPDNNGNISIFLNQKSNEILGEMIKDESLNRSIMNVSFNSLENNIETINKTSFSSSGFIRTFVMSEDKSILAIFTTNHVQIYFVSSDNFKYVSSLLHEDVSGIFIGKNYAVTTSHVENKLWFMASGVEIIPSKRVVNKSGVEEYVDIKLTNYKLKIGDIVNADIIINSILTKGNDIKITNIIQEPNGEIKYKNKTDILHNIVSKVNFKKFIFSPCEQYLAYNSDDGMKILDLRKMEIVKFVTFDSGVKSIKMEDFKDGIWSTVDNNEIFQANIVKDNNLWILNPKTQDIKELSGHVEKMPNKIAKSIILNDNKSLVPQEILNTKDIFDQMPGFWMYDHFVVVGGKTPENIQTISIYNTKYVYNIDVLIENDDLAERFETLNNGFAAFNFEDLEHAFIYHCNIFLNENSPTIRGLFINDVDLLQDPRKHYNKLPVFSFGNNESIYVTSGIDEYITLSYQTTESNDIITQIIRVDINGEIKYTIFGCVSIILNPLNMYNALILNVTDDNIEVEELKRSNDLFTYKSDKEIKELYSIVKSENIDEFDIPYDVFTTRKMVKYVKIPDKKPVDLFPVSSMLCLNRPDKYHLAKISPDEISGKTWRIYGNLLLSIEGNVLHVLPDVVQFAEQPESLNVNVLEWYDNMRAEDFNERFEQIKMRYRNIISVFPELQRMKLTDSKVFCLFTKNGFYKSGDFESWINTRLSENLDDKLMLPSDPRLRIILNLNNQELMKKFFSSDDILEYIFTCFANGNTQAVDQLRKIAPEISFPTVEFYDVFMKLTHFSTVARSQSKDAVEVINIMENLCVNQINHVFIKMLFGLKEYFFSQNANGISYGGFNAISFVNIVSFKENLFYKFEDMIKSCGKLLETKSTFELNRNKSRNEIIKEYNESNIKSFSMDPNIFSVLEKGESMLKVSLESSPAYLFQSNDDDKINETLNEFEHVLKIANVPNDAINFVVKLREFHLRNILPGIINSIRYVLEHESRGFIDVSNLWLLFEYINDQLDISDFVNDIEYNKKMMKFKNLINEYNDFYLFNKSCISIEKIDKNLMNAKARFFADGLNFNQSICDILKSKLNEKDKMIILNDFFKFGYSSDNTKESFGVNLDLLIRENKLMQGAKFGDGIKSLTIPSHLQYKINDDVYLVSRDKLNVIAGKDVITRILTSVRNLKIPKDETDIYHFIIENIKTRLNEITSFSKISDDLDDDNILEFDDKERVIDNDAMNSKIKSSKKSDNITYLKHVFENLNGPINYILNEIEQETLINLIKLLKEMKNKRITNPKNVTEDGLSEILFHCGEVILLTFRESYVEIKKSYLRNLHENMCKLLFYNTSTNTMCESLLNGVSLSEYEEDINNEISETLMSNHDERYNLFRNIHNYSVLDNDQLKIMESLRTDEFPRFKLLCENKLSVLKYIKLNIDRNVNSGIIYIKTIQQLIKRIPNLNLLENEEHLMFFIKYGYSDTFPSLFYSDEYKEYHFKSIQFECSRILEQKNLGQFIDPKDQIGFKKIEKKLLPLMNRYRYGEYYESKTRVNEISIVFDKNILFSSVDGDKNELGNIGLEFEKFKTNSDILTTSFSINLEEIIMNLIIDDPSRKIREILRIKESLERRFGIMFPNLNPVSKIANKNLSGIAMKRFKTVALLNATEYLTGLNFLNPIRMRINIQPNYYKDRLNVKPILNEFGYSILTPETPIHLLRGKFGNFETVVFNKETYFVNMFNTEQKGVIVLYKVSDLSRMIYEIPTKIDFDNVYCEDSVIYFGENRIIIQTLNSYTRIPEMTANDYAESSFDKTFIRKTDNISLFTSHYVTNMEQHTSQTARIEEKIVGVFRGKEIKISKIDQSGIKTKEHTGSCIKIVVSDKFTADLLFPSLMISDVALFPSINGEDATLTIIGKSVGGKFRLGSVNLNKNIFKANTKSSVIFTRFDREGIISGLANINNPQFKLVSSTIDYAYITGMAFDEKIKNKRLENEVGYLLIWGDKYVTTRQFNQRITDMSVSRYGNYVSVMFEDESVIFNRQGTKLASYTGSARWI
jgi:hypothetical protein